MLSLKFLLDTLNNDFSDSRIIKAQSYTDAVMTADTITVDLIDTIFPVGCYIMLCGTVFNNKVFKVTASTTGAITVNGVVVDPITKFRVKACLIPDEVLTFSETEHKIPMLDSETIGAYSYTASSPGVESFVRKSLSPYYNAVRC